MNKNEQFQKLEQKTYLQYHEDGLIDLIMGLSTIGFAFSMAIDSTVFFIFTCIPGLFFKPLKNKITFPRIGYVNFDTPRGRSARMALAGTVILLLGVMVMSAVWFLSIDRIDPAVRRWVADHFQLIFGAMLAAMLAGIAAVSGIRRMYFLLPWGQPYLWPATCLNCLNMPLCWPWALWFWSRALCICCALCANTPCQHEKPSLADQ